MYQTKKNNAKMENHLALSIKVRKLFTAIFDQSGSQRKFWFPGEYSMYKIDGPSSNINDQLDNNR